MNEVGINIPIHMARMTLVENFLIRCFLIIGSLLFLHSSVFHVTVTSEMVQAETFFYSLTDPITNPLVIYFCKNG